MSDFFNGLLMPLLSGGAAPASFWRRRLDLDCHGGRAIVDALPANHPPPGAGLLIRATFEHQLAIDGPHVQVAAAGLGVPQPQSSADSVRGS